MKPKGAIYLAALGLIGLGLPGLATGEKAELRGVGRFTVPAWFKTSFLDLRQDAADAAARQKRLLVYFGQSGCPYCAALFNTNFSQRRIVDYTRRHFDSLEINIWGDREVTAFTGETLAEKEFAAKLKVWFTPTIIFFDGQGTQILRINGYYAPHEFMAALRYVAERQERIMPFREYLAKRSPVPAAGKLHAEPFFAKLPLDLSKDIGARPVAVFFEQKDCAACDELHSGILKEPATLEQMKRFHVVQLDRWSDTPVMTPGGRQTTAKRWADELNIAYVPSALFFNEGSEIVRIEAFLKAFHVQSVMDYVASGAYKRQPSLQRFIRQRADHLRESGVVVDLWK